MIDLVGKRANDSSTLPIDNLPFLSITALRRAALHLNGVALHNSDRAALHKVALHNLDRVALHLSKVTLHRVALHNLGRATFHEQTA